MTSPRTATHPAAARSRTAARRPAPGRRPARRSSSGRRSATSRKRGSTGPQGIARWWPALLIAVVLVAAVAWGADRRPDIPAAGTCTVPDRSVTVTAEQATNAAAIAQVAWDRGLPERAVVIALATAQQESTMRNIDYGDRDSLGLFQQRPSQGWGTPEQVQDPVYAAGIFYDRLVQVPGWETGRLTEVAQTVQRSGFPEAYQKHESMAQELTAALTGNTLTCI